MTGSGRGIIGFTRVGEGLFPSQGYASIDDKAGVGEVHMIAEGGSTQHGFTEYPPIGGNRPRWGDYGASAVMAIRSSSRVSTSSRPRVRSLNSSQPGLPVLSSARR